MKFASGNFGVLERFAHVGSKGNELPTVPLSVRAVESELQIDGVSIPAGEISSIVTDDDVEVLAWWNRLQRLGESSIAKAHFQAIASGAEYRYRSDAPRVDVRTLSLFDHLGIKATSLKLPQAPRADERPFEVIGIPVAEPGFHVLEAKSQKLGAAMLENEQPMYVRTSVLVTNLSVHMKQGRDDFLVWVTTLDDAKVVGNAFVRALDCAGEELFSGYTNEHGVLHVGQAVSQRYCRATSSNAIYVSARIPADHPQALGKADFGFVLSDWNQGIESWRFNVPVGYGVKRDTVAHTILDRNLFRAGETVHMKHLMRSQSREGLVNPQRDRLTNTLRITHDGTGQSTELPLRWDIAPHSGAAAYSSFELPKEAKLGRYSLALTGENNWHRTGNFRVEEFKLPLLAGSIKVADQSLSPILVKPEQITVDMQLHYLSGGAAAQLPVTVSAVSRRYHPTFNDYREYSFTDRRRFFSEDAGPAAEQVLFLDKYPAVLDDEGGARITLDNAPPLAQPEQWVFEASFADPNGQLQTLTQQATAWPAHHVVGLSTPSWASAQEPVRIKTVVLSPEGTPQPDQKVRLLAEQRQIMTVRKRMVGGFYRYDNHEEHTDLGQLCHGVTNAKGEFECEVELDTSGSITVVAESVDELNHVAKASSTLWLSRGEALWFGGENDDRIDLIPESKVYAPVTRQNSKSVCLLRRQRHC